MPSLPSEQSPNPEREAHHARDVAESFGTDPERYDRSRPRYPEAMVRAIAAAGPDLLDVGCGTGIASRQFRAAGCRVLGVEVDARMAGFARRDGFDVDVAAFETWDPAGRDFDAVVAGQAWHWIDPVVGAARAAEVLRPGGRLAPFWNVAQPSADVGEAFAAVYRRVLPGPLVELAAKPALDLYAVMFAKAADGMRESGAFTEPEQWRFEWEHHCTREEWLDQLPTHGGLARLDPARLDELLTGVGAAIDAVGGSFTLHYTAVVVTATRTATGSAGHP